MADKKCYVKITSREIKIDYHSFETTDEKIYICKDCGLIVDRYIMDKIGTIKT